MSFHFFFFTLHIRLFLFLFVDKKNEEDSVEQTRAKKGWEGLGRICTGQVASYLAKQKLGKRATTSHDFNQTYRSWYAYVKVTTYNARRSAKWWTIISSIISRVMPVGPLPAFGRWLASSFLRSLGENLEIPVARRQESAHREVFFRVIRRIPRFIRALLLINNPGNLARDNCCRYGLQ